MTEPGFQVAPVTESDMNIVRDIFDRMARNIVNAAGVTDTLETMKAQITTLERYVEEYRNRNRELDEQVASVRRERDEAIERASRAEQKLKDIEDNRQSADRDIDTLRQDITRLNADLTQTRRERDDALYATEERNDKLREAKDWIENVSRLFNNPPQL